MEEVIDYEKEEKKLFIINKLTVKCIQDAVESGDFEIKHYDFKEYIRIQIDNVSVNIQNGKLVVLDMNADCDKGYMELWRYDVGGVLRQDVKTGNLSDYYEIITFGTRTLAKRVDVELDNEIVLKFREERLIKCGDYFYLPIKTVSKDSCYSSDSMMLNGHIEKPVKEDSHNDGFEEEDEFEENNDDGLFDFYIPKED